MEQYKVVYKLEKNEHVIELNAEDKEQAGRLAREQLGLAIRIVDVIHLPEQYGLDLF